MRLERRLLALRVFAVMVVFALVASAIVVLHADKRNATSLVWYRTENRTLEAKGAVEWMFDHASVESKGDGKWVAGVIARQLKNDLIKAS